MPGLPHSARLAQRHSDQSSIISHQCVQMLTLVIGNKNLSSWSLRPWLVLKHFGLPFQEVKLPLDTPAFHRDIVKYSPTKRVPLLIEGELKIWDSLAIAEYL